LEFTVDEKVVSRRAEPPLYPTHTVCVHPAINNLHLEDLDGRKHLQNRHHRTERVKDEVAKLFRLSSQERVAVEWLMLFLVFDRSCVDDCTRAEPLLWP